MGKECDSGTLEATCIVRLRKCSGRRGSCAEKAKHEAARATFLFRDVQSAGSEPEESGWRPGCRCSNSGSVSVSAAGHLRRFTCQARPPSRWTSCSQ